MVPFASELVNYSRSRASLKILNNSKLVTYSIEKGDLSTFKYYSKTYATRIINQFGTKGTKRNVKVWDTAFYFPKIFHT